MVKDFKLDSDQDIFIDPTTEDFVISDSDQQHVLDILQSVPGWWKEYPLIGVNPYKYTNARTSQQQLNQAIIIQLKSDGYEIGANGVNVELLPGGIMNVKTLDVKRS